MKMKFNVEAVKVTNGGKTLEWEGGSLEVEYEVGEMAEIIKVQIPAIKDLISTVMKDAQHYFDKVSEQKEASLLRYAEIDMLRAKNDEERLRQATK